MDSYVARELEVEFAQGAVVVDLDPEGSAAVSGLREKDVITKVNGTAITTTAELLEQIGRSRVGETIELTVVRSGKTIPVSVKLRSRPEGN
jgi:serine protease Do